MERKTLEEMNKRLLFLSKLVERMSENLEDRFLTAEEAKNILIAEKELAEGKTTSLKDMKAELGL